MQHALSHTLSGKRAVVLIAVSIAMVTALLSFLNYGLNGSYKVNVTDIAFAPAEKVAIPQRFEALGRASPASFQFRPRQADYRRFHFKFEGEPLDTVPHAIWIPHSGDQTKVYINGAQSGEGRYLGRVLKGVGVESYTYNIPRFQVLPGVNRIDIYIASDPSRSGLGPIYLGPAKAINKQRQRSERVSDILPVISYISALLALALNLLALLTPKGFLKFSGLTLSSLGLCALFHFGGIWPILPLIIGIGIYTVIEIRNKTLNPPKAVLIALGLCGPILSFLRAFGPFPFPDPGLVFISLWIGGLPILLEPSFKACLKMVAERRSRVNELEEALDDTKGILEKEIRRRAVFEERERLTRDIHDGVGGQLLGLLLRLRTGDVSRDVITRDLQYGLNDLRLVVDALDHTGNDLGNALRAFRDRATNQLDAAGLTLAWTQADDLNYEPQGQDAVINLYRILQEVINNIIRHAAAKHVKVDVFPQSMDQTLRIRIQDDGIGQEGDFKPGRGTLNIQRRAEILDGEIQTGKGLNNRGHSVTVSLPMSKISTET